MNAPISRRSLLIGLGGGLAATSIVWSLGRFDLWQGPQPDIRVVRPLTYVDHAGWLLSAEDKEKLTANVRFKQLDNTNLAGADIASRPVANMSACASWCTMESRCRSFAYLKPRHADPDRPSTCWIKSSIPDALPSDEFISGIVER